MPENSLIPPPLANEEAPTREYAREVRTRNVRRQAGWVAVTALVAGAHFAHEGVEHFHRLEASGHSVTATSHSSPSEGANSETDKKHIGDGNDEKGPAHVPAPPDPADLVPRLKEVLGGEPDEEDPLGPNNEDVPTELMGPNDIFVPDANVIPSQLDTDTVSSEASFMQHIRSPKAIITAMRRTILNRYTTAPESPVTAPEASAPLSAESSPHVSSADMRPLIPMQRAELDSTPPIAVSPDQRQN